MGDDTTKQVRLNISEKYQHFGGGHYGKRNKITSPDVSNLKSIHLNDKYNSIIYLRDDQNEQDVIGRYSKIINESNDSLKTLFSEYQKKKSKSFARGTKKKMKSRKPIFDLFDYDENKTKSYRENRGTSREGESRSTYEIARSKMNLAQLADSLANKYDTELKMDVREKRIAFRNMMEARAAKREEMAKRFENKLTN